MPFHQLAANYFCSYPACSENSQFICIPITLTVAKHSVPLSSATVTVWGGSRCLQSLLLLPLPLTGVPHLTEGFPHLPATAAEPKQLWSCPRAAPAFCKEQSLQRQKELDSKSSCTSLWVRAYPRLC